MNNNSINSNSQSMENIKNLVDSGNISEAISQISPEMIQNFSQMLSNQKSENQTNSNSQMSNSSNLNSNNNTNSASQNSSQAQNNNFNFNMDNIDINTIKNISSIMGNMNNTKNDPRANLLASLKPYLRDSKKSQLDNYMNLLNVSKIAEIMKNNNMNKEK